jgi:hypothetical protein
MENIMNALVRLLLFFGLVMLVACGDSVAPESYNLRGDKIVYTRNSGASSIQLMDTVRIEEGVLYFTQTAWDYSQSPWEGVLQEEAEYVLKEEKLNSLLEKVSDLSVADDSEDRGEMELLLCGGVAKLEIDDRVSFESGGQIYFSEKVSRIVEEIETLY